MSTERLVCFLLGDQELGLAIGDVKETIELRPVTRLFLVPDFVAGLCNMRGEVLAVLDLAKLLGLGHHVPRPESRIVVLRGRAPGRPVAAGLLVDAITDVRHLPPEGMHDLPPTLPADAAMFLRGLARIGDRAVMVLSVDKVLDCQALKPFRRKAA